MSNFSAQGSVTIRRLRNGDSFYISFGGNGKPLYQGVEPNSGAVAPDWSVADNQPVITPQVSTARGNSVSLSGFTWQYNGVALTFGTAGNDGWATDSTSKFRMNTTTGALRIVANLASTVNIANDTLLFSCVATVAGVEYNLSKSVDILIQNMGASSYYGTITAPTVQLTEAQISTTLTAALWSVSGAVADFYVKWYKDDTEWSAKAGQKSPTVTRTDVDGTQLFIAEFYNTSSDTTPLARAGIRIIDTADEYQVQFAITSANKEVDTGKSVTAQATLINMRTNTEVTPDGAAWRIDVMNKTTWDIKRSVSSSSITVTTEDTDDANGVGSDVELVAEVTWQ